MQWVKIVVLGRVQGVWFRDHVRKNAILLNLNGWVKNNPDGTVSAEVSGPETEIMSLVNKIKIGSPLSKVKEVKVDWYKNGEEYNSFIVKR